MAYLGHDWGDYQLLLYDKTRAYLGDLTHVRQLKYTKSVYGEGSFSFAVHVQDRFASLLSTQALTYVVIKRSGLTVFEGFTQKPAHRYAQDQQGLDEYIEVSGVCLAKLLDWRHAWDTTGHMEVTDHVDDIMKAVVDGSIGPGAPNAPDGSVRSLTGLSVAADKHEAANKTLDPKNANLGEWLRKTGAAYSVDFDVYFDASMDFVFETWYPRRGDDRSEINTDGNTPVIINDAGYNVQRANAYWDAYQLRNAVILEDGSGGAADAASIALFERRELLAKSTDTNRLDTFMAENELDAGCEFGEFMESVDCQWGTHFFLGDLLTWNNIHLGMTTAKHQLLSSIEVTIDDEDLEHLKIVFIESGESPDGEPDLADRMGGGGSGGDWGWDLPWAEASGIMPVQAACAAGSDLYIPRADHEHKFMLVTAGGNVSPTAGAAGGEITLVAGAGIAFTVAANSLTIAATGGHAPVTLDATIDANLLKLTGQELGLDTQAANYVFCGPETGAAAAPAFRKLIYADVATIVPSNTHHHHNTWTSTPSGDPSATLSHSVLWVGDDTDPAASTLNYTATNSGPGSSHNHSVTISCQPSADVSQSHTHTVTISGTPYTTSEENRGHTHTVYGQTVTSVSESSHVHKYDKTTSLSNHKHQYDKPSIQDHSSHKHNYDRANQDTSRPQ